MSHYSIGDVQGCFIALLALLDKINFDRAHDTLWFTGDLINRGSQSLATLRFVKDLGDRAITVLGNHDLHLLAVAKGVAHASAQDTLAEILAAPDCQQLCDWLRQQPFLHYDAELNYLLVHAGIPPSWDLSAALQYAAEAEKVLRGEDYHELLAQLYGDSPDKWQENLTGWPRLRLIINYFTRMRFCSPTGQLDLISKGEMAPMPAGFLPWFKIPQRQLQAQKIIFGHWAALKGAVDTPNIFALDTGCVWGNCLTAMRLEDGVRFTVLCEEGR